jgi:hypothetical protein
MYLVGYYGGKFDPIASPFENWYRALGCQSALEFHSLTDEQVDRAAPQSVAPDFQAPWY